MTAPFQPTVSPSPLPPWLQGLLGWAQSRRDVAGINADQRPPEMWPAGGVSGAAHSPTDVVAAARADALPAHPSFEQRIREQITGTPAQAAASTQTRLPEQVGQFGNLTPLSVDDVVGGLTGMTKHARTTSERVQNAAALALMFMPGALAEMRGLKVAGDAAPALDALRGLSDAELARTPFGKAPAFEESGLSPKHVSEPSRWRTTPAQDDMYARFLARREQRLGPPGGLPPIEPETSVPRSLLGLNERGMIGPLYHGSPHDFSNFDVSKIGTGEGAAAYGHGLYFASAKDVGEFYRNQLAGQPEIMHLRLGDLDVGPHNGFDYSPKGKTLEENIRSSLTEDLLIDQQTLTANGPKGVQKHALDLLDQRIEAYKTEWPEGVAAAQRLRKQLAKKGAVSLEMVEHPGKLYTVDVDAHPEQLLDWDKPLHEQSPQAQAAIHEALGPNVGKTEAKDGLQLAGGGTLRVVEDPDFGTRYWMEIGGKKFRLAKQDIPNLLGQGTEGKSVYQQLAHKLGSDKAASDYLHERGLKGIRYLDSNSRTPGTAVVEDFTERATADTRAAALRAEGYQHVGVAKRGNGWRVDAHEKGTHNYVVFHHDPIKITNKGRAAVGMLAGTGAAAGAALTGGLALENHIRKQIGPPPKR